MFLAAGYAVHRMRVARLVELERVRTRIATDLHDDIGASLSYMSILTEVANRQSGTEQQARQNALSEIAATARELVDSMSDIVWAVDPENDRMRDVAQRMRWLGEELFQARKVRFHFEGPAEGDDRALSADLRRELFLIFKEAVNNVAKHSGCREVHADFHIEREWLVLRLKDDGSGFDPSQAAHGHGLRSMEARAKHLGGLLEIASRPGEGCRITLRAPVNGARTGWKRFLHERIGTNSKTSS